MVYEEYDLYLWQYRATLRQFNDILLRKEELFQITQAKAITYDKDKVSGGVLANTLDIYITKKDELKIDEAIEEVKSILEDREKLLKTKEKELRESTHLYDKVYRMRYLDRLSPYIIGEKIGYSKTQIYRILKKINKNLKDGTKWDN